MVWKTQYDPTTGIVEVIYSGLVTSQELKDAVTERVSLQQKFDLGLVLVDTRDIEQFAGNSFDIYSLPADEFEKKGANRQTRMALRPPTKNELHKFAHFWETACLNRGWIVKIIENREEAIAWLLGTEPTDPDNTRRV